MLPLSLIGRGENRSQSDGSCQGHKHPLDVGVLKPLKQALLLAIAKGSQNTWAVKCYFQNLSSAALLSFSCLLEGEKIISFSQDT